MPGQKFFVPAIDFCSRAGPAPTTPTAKRSASFFLPRREADWALLLGLGGRHKLADGIDQPGDGLVVIDDGFLVFAGVEIDVAPLKAALEALGFGPCYHMSEVLQNMETMLPLWEAALDGTLADWSSIFANYQATVDWPACNYYEQLMAAFPDAKVLLSVRDPKLPPVISRFG